MLCAEHDKGSDKSEGGCVAQAQCKRYRCHREARAYNLDKFDDDLIADWKMFQQTARASDGEQTEHALVAAAGIRIRFDESSELSYTSLDLDVEVLPFP